jgi:hypothetical protein
VYISCFPPSDKFDVGIQEKGLIGSYE